MEYNEFAPDGYLGSVEDLADLTGLSVSAVHKILRRNKIKPALIDGRKYYYGDDAADLLEQHKPRQKAQTSEKRMTLQDNEEYEKRISHLEEKVDKILERQDRLERHLVTIVKKVQEVLEVSDNQT